MTLTVGYHARPTLGLQGYLTTVSGGGEQDLEETALGEDFVLGGYRRIPSRSRFCHAKERSEAMPTVGYLAKPTLGLEG